MQLNNNSLLFSPTCLNPLEGLVDFTLDVKPYHTKLLETGVLVRFDDLIKINIDEHKLSLIELLLNTHMGICDVPTMWAQGFENEPYEEDQLLGSYGNSMSVGLGFEPTTTYEITNEDTGYPANQVDGFGRPLYFRFPDSVAGNVESTCEAMPIESVPSLKIKVRRIFVETAGDPIRIEVELPAHLKHLDLFAFKSITLPQIIAKSSPQDVDVQSYQQLLQLLTNGEILATLVTPTPQQSVGWFRGTFELHRYGTAIERGFVGSYSDWVDIVASTRTEIGRRNVGRIVSQHVVDIGGWSSLRNIMVDSVGRVVISLATSPGIFKTGDVLNLNTTTTYIPDVSWLMNIVAAGVAVEQISPINDLTVNYPRYLLRYIGTGEYVTEVDLPSGFVSFTLDADHIRITACRSGYEMYLYELNLFESGLTDCNTLTAEMCDVYGSRACITTQQLIRVTADRPYSAYQTVYIPTSSYEMAVARGFVGTEDDWIAAVNADPTSHPLQGDQLRNRKYDVLPTLPKFPNSGIIGLTTNVLNVNAICIASIDLEDYIPQPFVVDGVVLNSGDQVVLNGQQLSAENGVYVYNSTVNRLFPKRTNSMSDVFSNDIFVLAGHVHAGTRWRWHTNQYNELVGHYAMNILVQGKVSWPQWNFSNPSKTLYYNINTGQFAEGDQQTNKPPGNYDEFVVAGMVLDANTIEYVPNPTFCLGGYDLYEVNSLSYEDSVDFAQSIVKRCIPEPVFEHAGNRYIQPTTISPRFRQFLTVTDVTNAAGVVVMNKYF